MLTQEEVKSIVLELVPKYISIIKVELIGSFAKGIMTEKSDVDLIVTFNLDSDTIDDDYYDFKEELECRLKREVDLLTALGVEHSFMKESLLDGGVTLYG